MKSRESILRLKRFQEQEKRRQVQQIETMIAEFARMATDLDGQIAYEERRAGIDDVNHFAYPTFAKAARQRRDNLQVSIDDLNQQLANARDELTEVGEELAKAEKLEERDGGGAIQAPETEIGLVEQRAMIG